MKTHYTVQISVEPTGKESLSFGWHGSVKAYNEVQAMRVALRNFSDSPMSKCLQTGSIITIGNVSEPLGRDLSGTDSDVVIDEFATMSAGLPSEPVLE